MEIYISDRVRLIKSQANTDIGLKELLKKHGGICVESGIHCRNCFQKIIKLGKKVFGVLKFVSKMCICLY